MGLALGADSVLGSGCFGFRDTFHDGYRHGGFKIDRMGGEETVSIEKTIRTLSNLAELIKYEITESEEAKEDDIHIIAVNEDDFKAVENALNMIRGLKILNSIFSAEEGSE